jgi:hypothetical protein
VGVERERDRERESHTPSRVPTRAQAGWPGHLAQI